MRTTLIMAVLPFLLCPVHAADDDLLVEFRKEKRRIELQLASVNLNDRVAGLNALRKYPSVDAVRLALPHWSKDPSPAVRSTAGEVLFSFKDHARLRPALRAELKKEINETTSILLAAWLAGADARERQEMIDGLNKLYLKRPEGHYSLFTVADWLATQQYGSAVVVLSAFADLDPFKRQFAFRRCVVMALTGVRHPEAVDRLVALLPQVDGEVRADIIRHLTQISRQNFGDDNAAWQEWWRGNKAGFSFPDAVQLRQAALQRGTATYYGIPVVGKKVIFILDTSGSMKGQRIVSAKKELIRTIEELPTTTSFNLVAFNSELGVWRRGLEPAAPTTKARGVRWVEELPAGGATFTFDALKATLEQQPEAIYLLTDGEPTGGAIVEPDAIVEAVRQMNRYRRCTIHVIGVAPGPEDGPFSQFMKKLAAENWGQYRRVE